MSSDARSTADRVEDAAGDVASAATDAADGVAAAVETSADEAADAVTDTTSSIGEVATDAAQRAGAAAQRAGEVVADVAGTAASTVQTHAPAVIDASRTTAGIAYRQVRKASNDQLLLGTVFTAGVVAGLVLGRVPRLLVLAALVPVAVLGGTLLGRRVTGIGRRAGDASR
ncbi:MAG: hypothetical protein KF809_00705 [Chloroflexi bacterium]|nr:hypothetical protein [Chloroflexota bacterium]